MNNNDFDRSELNSLLDDLCNGTLEGIRHQRLQAILHASGSARAEYLEMIDLHIDLKRLHSRPGDLVHGPSPLLEPASRRTRRMLPWAVLAATVLLGLGIAWVSTNGANGILSSGDDQLAANQQFPPVAAPEIDSNVMLAQISTARFFGENIPAVGSSLALDHKYALTDGMIELRFPSGASTIIEAPAIFEIPSTDRLLLLTGNCSVYAPEGAQGFRVDTPLANVVDLGTRFVVSVTQSGETAVRVVEGEADVFARTDPDGDVAGFEQPINLHQHQSSLIGGRADVDSIDDMLQESNYTRALPDRVLEYEAQQDTNGAVNELLAVSVQRAGVERRYEVDELIGIDVIHYHADRSDALMLLATDGSNPSPALLDCRFKAETLDRDRSLCSGIINPGGSTVALAESPILEDPTTPERVSTPGLGIRFQQPVTNSAGPDVVFLEFQKIIDPETGDPFHVSPLRFEPGLHSFTVKKYDISLVSPQAKFVSPFRLFRVIERVHSLSQLTQAKCSDNRIHQVPGKIMAVGIDLTDLGYEPGAKVEGLFFQDTLDDPNYIDPVFIAGLPPVP